MQKHTRAYFNRLNDHAILMKKMEAVSSIVNLTSLSSQCPALNPILSPLLNCFWFVLMRMEHMRMMEQRW